MYLPFHQLEDGTLFFWGENIYRKIKDVINSSGTIIDGEAQPIAYQDQERDWIFYHVEECRFNSYSEVLPVKLCFTV